MSSLSGSDVLLSLRDRPQLPRSLAYSTPRHPLSMMLDSKDRDVQEVKYPRHILIVGSTDSGVLSLLKGMSLHGARVHP